MTPPSYQAQLLDRDSSALRFSLAIPTDSPYLHGHFPDQPILPGVAQVQICTELLAQELKIPVKLREVLNVRFRKPVTPDLACEMELRLDGYELAFTLRSEQGNMSEGNLLLADRLEIPDAEVSNHA